MLIESHLASLTSLTTPCDGSINRRLGTTGDLNLITKGPLDDRSKCRELIDDD